MTGWNLWKACGNLTATPRETRENNCSFFTWRKLAHRRQTGESSASFAPILPICLCFLPQELLLWQRQ